MKHPSIDTHLLTEQGVYSSETPHRLEQLGAKETTQSLKNSEILHNLQMQHELQLKPFPSTGLMHSLVWYKTPPTKHWPGMWHFIWVKNTNPPLCSLQTEPVILERRAEHKRLLVKPPGPVAHLKGSVLRGRARLPQWTPTYSVISFPGKNRLEWNLKKLDSSTWTKHSFLTNYSLEQSRLREKERVGFGNEA